MIASLLLALLVTLSGTVATYLYDENASLGARYARGAALGLAALGLVSFVVASFIGLSGIAVLFSMAICCSPLRITHRRKHPKTLQTRSRRRFDCDSTITPNRNMGGRLFSLLRRRRCDFWKVFSRAVIEDSTGLSTGLLNNFGDLPFHLSVITSFAFGNNFPPEDPTYAGVRFTYPFHFRLRLRSVRSLWR